MVTPAAAEFQGGGTRLMILDALERIGRFTLFAGQALAGLPRGLTQPGAFVQQLRQVLLGALPLGLVAGVALGVVVWLHLHRILARFSAEQYLPQALALALV